MYKKIVNRYAVAVVFALTFAACKAPAVIQPEKTPVPESYATSTDTTNTATVSWRTFFTDPNLVALIDVALKNNQELLSTLQEIKIARSEVRMRKGAILPTVGLKAGAGLEKVGRFTSQGAGDASTEIEPGREMPDPLPDYTIGAYANWEVDIWKKLRNSKKAAVNRYLATVEGKNFLMTNLVSEVADSYYELLSLDSQLDIVRKNIALQQQARDIVKAQKEAARANELAVQKFEAETLASQAMEFDLMQKITETENRLNLLLGRYPQPIKRTQGFMDMVPFAVQSGIPSQLLENRPDIKQAELELMAAKLDVKAARAEFYPSLGISAGIGFQAFKPSYLFRTPESLLYTIAGDLAAPLINRNAIRAEFNSANARQLQALYDYEKTVLTAYLEVMNGLSRIGNLNKRYELQSKQVAALDRSIDVASDLFRSARADYLEVLMTQRDALESKLELAETKQQQLSAVTLLYRNLGGGAK